MLIFIILKHPRVMCPYPYFTDEEIEAGSEMLDNSPESLGQEVAESF